MHTALERAARRTHAREAHRQWRSFARSERRHAAELATERNEHIRELKELRDELQAARDHGLTLSEERRAAVEEAKR